MSTEYNKLSNKCNGVSSKYIEDITRRREDMNFIFE